MLISLESIFIYVLGGITFIPLVLTVILLHAWISFPIIEPPIPSLREPDDDANASESEPKKLRSYSWLSSHDADVGGYFAVCREFVPGGVNGKPPERTSPSGAVIPTENPSVYQSMYRGIFQKKQTVGQNVNGPVRKKANNVFYVVLRFVQFQRLQR
jgi:hypothetical protein